MPQFYPVFQYIVQYIAQYAMAIRITLTVASIAYSIRSNQIAKSRMRNAIREAQGITQSIRSSAQPRAYVYGRRRVGGTIVYMQETGTDRKYLHIAQVFCSHEVNAILEFYYNENKLSIDSSGNVLSGSNTTTSGTTTVPYNSKAFLSWKTGYPGQDAISQMLAWLPNWTSAHTLQGCAYMFTRLEYDQQIWSGGIPNLSALIEGKKIYDPRDEVTRWSDNPALIALDMLTDTMIGGGVPLSSIDLPTVIASANICDEMVALAGGGSEPRYRANHFMDSSIVLDDHLQAICNAMAGTITRSSGKWYIKAGAYYAPEVSFSDADVIGQLQVQPRLAKRALCNAVKGMYIDADNGYVATDIPCYPANPQSSTYVAQDSGEVLWRDLSLDAVVSSTQAQRLEKIELERTRRQETVILKTGPRGLLVRPGDNIYLTLSKYGWTNKVFEVQNWKFNATPTGSSTNESMLTVEMVLRAMDASVWAWSAEETVLDPAQDTSLPDPFSVAPVTGLTPTNDSALQSDGAIVSAVVLSWTAPLDGYVQKGGRIRIQYKPHTDSAWLDSASVDGAQTKAKLFNLIQGGRYDFQLQAVNYMGVQSAWVQALDFLVAKDTTAPAAPTGVVAQAGTGALISLDWDDNTEVDFDEYHVYRGTTSSTGSMTKIAQVGASRFVDSMVTIGTTYYYAIKAVDRSENVSAFSAVVSATPTGVSGSGTNTTAPSNAGQLTFVSSGAYQASDGTTFSYINVSVPALPTGAAWQNLVINNSGTYEIVGQLTNTSTVTSYRVDDLVAGKSYELGLIAYNSDGVPSSYVAGLTFPRTTPMDTTAPAVPSGLSAQAGTGKLIVLTWSPNTEADFSEYQVWRNTSNSSGSATKIAETSATAFADATVTIGITYYYWLKAADCTDNVSGFSSVASAAASNVPASQVDQTAPTAPSAASKTASGSYLSADGNVSSYFDFSVPGLPGGAKWQSLMYRRTGGNDWQVGWQGSNAGTVTVRLDDLTPGVSYDVATVAISAFGVFSGYTAATGSPFTGQVDTTAPAAPTGVHASNDGVTPSLSPGGYLMMGVRFYWTNPTDADFDHIEYKVTVINDSTAVGTVVQIAKSTELIYRMVSISGFWWFRSVDRTGNFSAWVGTPETAASYQTLGIGSIASENKAATKLSGLSVGDASASSVRKVIAHFETTAVWVTSATPSTAQNFDLDISNRGFTTKPDSVKITAASPDDGVGAQYAYDDAASTSTNLRVRLYGRGGANLPASTAFRYSIDATCYN